MPCHGVNMPPLLDENFVVSRKKCAKIWWVGIAFLMKTGLRNKSNMFFRNQHLKTELICCLS